MMHGYDHASLDCTFTWGHPPPFPSPGSAGTKNTVLGCCEAWEEWHLHSFFSDSENVTSGSWQNLYLDLTTENEWVMDRSSWHPRVFLDTSCFQITFLRTYCPMGCCYLLGEWSSEAHHQCSLVVRKGTWRHLPHQCSLMNYSWKSPLGQCSGLQIAPIYSESKHTFPWLPSHFERMKLPMGMEGLA